MEDRFRQLLFRLDAAHRAGRHRTFLELLDEAYVRASASERDAVRALFRADEQLDRQIFEQLQGVAEQAEKAGEFEASLRAQLLEFSLTYHYDSRDALMSLAEMWQWAQSKGLDPAPLFREIGDVSSPEATHLIGGSAQGMIFRVAEDPAYRAALLERPARPADR
jgi:hypothetical protein